MILSNEAWKDSRGKIFFYMMLVLIILPICQYLRLPLVSLTFSSFSFMIFFSLFPLLSHGHYWILLLSQTLRESVLLIPILNQLPRSKGHHLILFIFFKYSQQFCNLIGKWSGKKSDPYTNLVKWHEYAQTCKIIPFPLTLSYPYTQQQIVVMLAQLICLNLS